MDNADKGLELPHGTSAAPSTRDIVRFLWSKYRAESRTIVAATVAMSAAAGLQMLFPLVVKRMLAAGVDAADNVVDDESRALHTDDTNASIFFGEALRVVACILGYHGVSLVGHVLAHKATVQATLSILNDGLMTTLEAPWSDVVSWNPQQLCQLIVSASKLGGDTIAAVITEVAVAAFGALGIVCALVYTSWPLTVALLLVSAVAHMTSHVLDTVLFGESAAAAAEKHSWNEGRMSALLLNAVQRCATLRVFPAARWFVQASFDKQKQRTYHSAVDLNYQIHSRAAMNAVITSTMLSSVVGMAGYLQAAGYLTMVDVGLFFFYVKLLADRLTTIATEAQKILTLIGKAREYCAFRQVRVNPPPPQRSELEAMDRTTTCGANAVLLELKGVCVAYRCNGGRGESDVVRVPDLEVRAGDIVALVGRSGSGKSTTLRIVSGLIEATRGIVRRPPCVALLEQHPTLFLGSIKDNIAVGGGGSSLMDNQIVAAAKAAGCHEFVSRLPEGYDTLVDNTDQAQFSGGQLQRICLARVFLSDAQLIVLDEPTTGLDKLSSDVVINTMLALQGEGRAILLASHDQHIVQRATNVVDLSAANSLS